MPLKITAFSYLYELCSFGSSYFAIIHVLMRKSGIIFVFGKNTCFALCIKTGDISHFTHSYFSDFSQVVVSFSKPLQWQFIILRIAIIRTIPKAWAFCGWWWGFVGFLVGLVFSWCESPFRVKESLMQVVSHSIYLTPTEHLSKDFLKWYKISWFSGSFTMNGCICFY